MDSSCEKKSYICYPRQIVMSVFIDEKDLSKLIVIGDRILIKPKVPQSKTKTGLLLPPGVNENEKVQIGFVVKVGPGYPIPSLTEADEPWKNEPQEPKYVPLAA
jgi:chaperonin GroES